MKLYLASYRMPTPDDFARLVGKEPAQTKLALINNAKDFLAKRARDFKDKDLLNYLKDKGFNTELLDLRDFDEAELKTKLQEFDAVWAAGGNTFCLRYQMKRSGFENIIRELLENGLVYGGDSAGAIVMGPTLKGTETADEPKFAEQVIWKGLNLTDKIIIPHVDNMSLHEALKPMLELYKNNPDAIKLNDNQAYVINNDQSQVVTGTI